jgi:hypothetical protein
VETGFPSENATGKNAGAVSAFGLCRTALGFRLGGTFPTLTIDAFLGRKAIEQVANGRRTDWKPSDSFLSEYALGKGKTGVSQPGRRCADARFGISNSIAVPLGAKASNYLTPAAAR